MSNDELLPTERWLVCSPAARAAIDSGADADGGFAGLRLRAGHVQWIAVPELAARFRALLDEGWYPIHVVAEGNEPALMQALQAVLSADEFDALRMHDHARQPDATLARLGLPEEELLVAWHESADHNVPLRPPHNGPADFVREWHFALFDVLDELVDTYGADHLDDTVAQVARQITPMARRPRPRATANTAPVLQRLLGAVEAVLALPGALVAGAQAVKSLGRAASAASAASTTPAVLTVRGQRLQISLHDGFKAGGWLSLRCEPGAKWLAPALIQVWVDGEPVHEWRQVPRPWFGDAENPGTTSLRMADVPETVLARLQQASGAQLTAQVLCGVRLQPTTAESGELGRWSLHEGNSSWSVSLTATSAAHEPEMMLTLHARNPAPEDLRVRLLGYVAPQYVLLCATQALEPVSDMAEGGEWAATVTLRGEAARGVLDRVGHALYWIPEPVAVEAKAGETGSLQN